MRDLVALLQAFGTSLNLLRLLCWSSQREGTSFPQKIPNLDLTIYEKNAGVGGTWFSNRYPYVSPPGYLFVAQVY